MAIFSFIKLVYKCFKDFLNRIVLCAPLPSKRPKTAQKLLQIARCISALKIALNCTEMPLTRRFFACSFAFFRVIALLSVCVITNSGTLQCGAERHDYRIQIGRSVQFRQ